jgi:hypothetical protein
MMIATKEQSIIKIAQEVVVNDEKISGWAVRLSQRTKLIKGIVDHVLGKPWNCSS